jgi:hypothetical protein
VVWWLRQQRPQGQPYPFVLAAGKHGHLLEHFRTQLVRQPWHLHAAAALAASPRLEDREFARSKLHEPVIQTQMQRQLLAFVRSENLFWLTPFPSCPDQRWCGEHSWKLNLVARLRRDGAYPHLPAQELWDWYQSDARHEIAASDLAAELGRPVDWCCAEDLLRMLYRARSREQAWSRIESLRPEQRFRVVMEGWRNAHPEDWGRLTDCSPPGPEIVGEERWREACELARDSERLRAWLDRGRE